MTDRAEWHEWRAKGIGASDIAGLLGLSSYSSPYSLWLDKTGQLPPRPEDTARQRIGKRMEALLAAEFHDHYPYLWAVGEQTLCEHPDHPWMRCTVDGFAVQSAGAHDISEAVATVQYKTDGRHSWPDGIPVAIRAQCIWEMAVTGLRHCFLVVMFAGFRVEVFEIPWDESAESDWLVMRVAAEEFWHDHVLAGVAPPIDDSSATTDALELMGETAERSPMAADAKARALVADIRTYTLNRKQAEADENRAKNELRALMIDYTDLIDGEVTIATWRPQVRRTIDTGLLKERYPDIAAECTKETPSRPLLVPDRKGN